MKNGYVKSLDGLRAFAIILVMSFHAALNQFGWLGVQLFFVLSGFLITRILWTEKDKPVSNRLKLKKFWVRRSLRIFPLYFGFLLVLLITALCFQFPIHFFRYLPYLATYTYNYTRLMSDWQVTPMFTHLWSLCIEEQFYLFFPMLIFFASRGVIKIVMTAFIFLSPLIRFLLQQQYQQRGLAPEVVADAVYWQTLSHLDAFFAGGLITIYSLHTRIKKPAANCTFALLTAIASGAISFFSYSPHGNYPFNLGYGHGQTAHAEPVWTYTVLNIFFASLILLLVSVKPNRSLVRMLESAILVRIGRVSYGMYIFHWPILFYIFQRYVFTNNNVLNLLLFVPYLFAVYLVAEISFRFFESPFIRLKDKFFPPAKGERLPINHPAFDGAEEKL